MPDGKIIIETGLDTSGILKDIERLKRSLEGAASTFERAFDFDTSEGQAGINQIKSALDSVEQKAKALDNVDPEVTVTGDAGNADQVLSQVQADAEDLGNFDPEVTVSGDAIQAQDAIAQTQADAEALNAIDPEVTATANTAQASTAIDGLTGKVKQLVAAYAGIEGIKSMISVTDQYTSAMSRLNMMTGGSRKASEAIYASIVAAANRSRGSITSMSDLVGKLGVMAKGAFKGGNKEVVDFAEQINKLGVISGSTTEQMNAGMMQLTQSLTSGKLQGDELRSVLENMPGVANTLAKGLGVSTGELRKMGAEGQLTSDKVVGAIMKMKGQTDKDFNGMSWTFSQMWQMFKNEASQALIPANEKLSAFANSPEFKAGMGAMARVVGLFAQGLVGILTVAGQVGNALKPFTPILAGIAGAIGTIAAIMIGQGLILKITQLAMQIPAVIATISAALGPVGLIAVAIAGIAAGLAVLYQKNAQFRDIVNSAWTMIRTAIQSAWAMIKPAFDSIAQALGVTGQKSNESKNSVSALSMILSTVVAPAFQHAAGFVSNIIKAFGSLVSGVAYTVNFFVNIFKGNWSGAWSSFKGIAKSAMGVVKGSFNALLSLLPKSVRQHITGMLQAGKDLIAGLWNGIKSKFGGVIKKVGSFAEAIKNKFKKVFGIHSPSTVFYDFGIFMFQGLENALTNSPFAALGTATAQSLKNGFSSNAMLTATTDGVMASQTNQTVAKTATGQSADSQTTITNDLALDVNALTTAAPLMQTAALMAFSPIANVAETQSDLALTATKTDVAAIPAYLAVMFGVFRSSGYTTFNALTTAAQNRGNAARGAIITTIAQMIAYIRSQYGAFYSVGSYTIQGFINGINSQRARAISVTNALVQAVKNAFVKGLGIHSPSTVAYDYGRYTGIGFINGLSSTQLGQFARSTVTDMKSAFAKSKFSAEANVNYMDDDSMKEVNWMRKYDGGSVVKGADGGKGGRFVSHMLGLVNDDRHGYSQSNRWGPDYDCSSSIITSLRAAGFNTGAASTTHNMSSELTKHGWLRLPYKNPKKGDILLNDATHTEMSLGNGKTAGFHSSHGHPETGDQAHEAYVGRDPGRWAAILRYKHGFGDSLADAIEEAYNFKKYGFGTLDAEGDGGDLGGANIKVSGKLSDWVKAALKLTHQPESLLKGLMRAAMAESGGNPKAINNWDINAKLGHPSKGLMQTIDSTFNAYKVKGHGNIWNPIDNMAAAIRYMIARYGSVANVLRPRAKKWYGYAVGSRYITRDQFAQIHAGEAVVRAKENPYANSNGGFMTTALQNGVNAVMADFANKVAVRSGGMTNETTVTNNNDMTQNVYFQETPKQPSEYRAALRQYGRRIAFEH